jgi:hypothetical protein
MAQVVNKRTYTGEGIYIGRPSRWGNPFSHRPETKALHVVATVELAVDAYRAWLWEEIKAGRITLEELAELHGQTLICWCKPGPCHGDVLAAAAAWADDKLFARDHDELLLPDRRAS